MEKKTKIATNNFYGPSRGERLVDYRTHNDNICQNVEKQIIFENRNRLSNVTDRWVRI